MFFQTEYFEKAYNDSDQFQSEKCPCGKYSLSYPGKCSVRSWSAWFVAVIQKMNCAFTLIIDSTKHACLEFLLNLKKCILTRKTHMGCFRIVKHPDVV